MKLNHWALLNKLTILFAALWIAVVLYIRLQEPDTTQLRWFLDHWALLVPLVLCVVVLVVSAAKSRRE